jgi:hypothetical protein
LKNNYVLLTPAEEILQINPISDEYATPKFFRKTGPVYADIEQGKVYIRKEVNQIIETLQKGKSVFLSGNAASGKTVLSRVIAKNCIENKQHVFFINLKLQQESLDIYKLLEETNNLVQETQNSLIIIEDAHLKADLINTFLSKKNNDWPQLLITARDSYNEKLSKDEIDYFKILEKPILYPAETIEKIILNFFHDNNWNKNEKLEREIKKVSKGNLWLLSYVLRSIKKTNGEKIHRKLIIEEVRKDLNSISLNNNFLYVRILITLSVLYRFEMPTDIRFLYEKFSKDPDVIENAMRTLCQMGEIVMIQKAKHTLYGLPHSALADLYFQFSKDSKWEYDKVYGDEKYFIWSYFISKKSSNWVQLLEGKYSDIGRKFLKIVKSKMNIDELSQKTNELNCSTNVAEIIEFVFEISQEAGVELWGKIDKAKLIKRIEESDDITMVGEYLNNFFRAYSKAGKELAMKIDKVKLAKKIVGSNDLKQVGEFINLIFGISEKAGTELWEKIDKGKLSEKIVESGNLSHTGKCINNIFMTSKEAGTELWRKIDKAKLAKKIVESDDLKQAGYCIALISSFSKEAGSDLCGKIGEDKLEKIIDKSDSSFSVGACIHGIFKFSEESGLDLWEKIDKDKLAKIIVESDDVYSVGSGIQIIFQASKKAGEELWEKIDKNKLSVKIVESDDLFMSGTVIEMIFKVSKEAGSELWERLDKDKLAKIIVELDYDFFASSCIQKIFRASKKAGNELWEKIDKDKLIKKIDESNDINSRGKYINSIFEVSKEVGEELWDGIDKDMWLYLYGILGSLPI